MKGAPRDHIKGLYEESGFNIFTGNFPRLYTARTCFIQKVKSTDIAIRLWL